jgi:hypothetical protein
MKTVDKVPGIGKVLGGRLEEAGFDRVSISKLLNILIDLK